MSRAAPPSSVPKYPRRRPLHRVQPRGDHIGVGMAFARIGIALQLPLVLRVPLLIAHQPTIFSVSLNRRMLSW